MKGLYCIGLKATMELSGCQPPPLPEVFGASLPYSEAGCPIP